MDRGSFFKKPSCMGAAQQPGRVSGCGGLAASVFAGHLLPGRRAGGRAGQRAGRRRTLSMRPPLRSAATMSFATLALICGARCRNCGVTGRGATLTSAAGVPAFLQPHTPARP